MTSNSPKAGSRHPFDRYRAIAATMVATIAVSLAMTACQGRRMSNMKPDGDTVEVVIQAPADSIPADSNPTDSII